MPAAEDFSKIELALFMAIIMPLAAVLSLNSWIAFRVNHTQLSGLKSHADARGRTSLP